MTIIAFDHQRQCPHHRHSRHYLRNYFTHRNRRRCLFVSWLSLPSSSSSFLSSSLSSSLRWLTAVCSLVCCGVADIAIIVWSPALLSPLLLPTEVPTMDSTRSCVTRSAWASCKQVLGLNGVGSCGSISRCCCFLGHLSNARGR